MIYGLEDAVIELNAKFSHLQYLYLHSVTFTDSKLLKSSEIETLIVDWSFFETVESLQGSPSSSMYGFSNLESKKVKHLKFSQPTENEFYHRCVEKHLFDNLEYLNVVLYETDTLVYLNEHCKSLKRIDCLFGADRIEFLELVSVNELKKVANVVRDGLVYLFGIKLSKSTASFIIDLFRLHSDMFHMEDSSVELATQQLNLKRLRSLDKQQDLDEFYKLVKTIHVHDQNAIDKSIFRKFVNCDRIIFSLHSNLTASQFKEYIETIPNIERIILQFSSDFKCGNDVLDLIGDRCRQVHHLHFENWNKINLDFVFKLNRLKILKAFLYFPVDQADYMKLIRQLKHLELIDICFKRPANYTKDQLSSFKKMVNACFSEELKLSNFSFKIEVHSKNTHQFIRYYFKRGELRMKYNQYDRLSAEDEEKMFYILQKRKSK